MADTRDITRAVRNYTSTQEVICPLCEKTFNAKGIGQHKKKCEREHEEKAQDLELATRLLKTQEQGKCAIKS